MRTRKHHNNKGVRQIKTGRTEKDVEKYRQKYIKKTKGICVDCRRPFQKCICSNDAEIIKEKKE